MKQLWLTDQEQIAAEIDRLIAQKTTLFCLRRDKQRIARLRVTGTTAPKSGKMLVVHHPHEPSCNKPTCLFYYHLANKPLRVFECQRVKKISTYLGLRFPEEIFEVQRRRYPRVPTPHHSTAVFSFARKQRVYHATVEDVSAGGVKLLTNIPDILHKGTVITPLTLTLFLRFRTNEETLIIVPEATVQWTALTGESTTKMGLHFALQGGSLEAITDYIDARSIEESLVNR